MNSLYIIFNKSYKQRTLNEYLIYNHTVHQYRFICVNDIIKVDQVLRLESLCDDIKSLPDGIGINKSIKLTKLNKSSRQTKYLNENIANNIYEFYKMIS